MLHPERAAERSLGKAGPAREQGFVRTVIPHTQGKGEIAHLKDSPVVSDPNGRYPYSLSTERNLPVGIHHSLISSSVPIQALPYSYGQPCLGKHAYRMWHDTHDTFWFFPLQG